MSENSPPDDLERLEKLALGLLVTPGDPRETHARLFLGKIPENVLVELPIPEQTQVLGTLARSEANFEIVLESTLTAEEVLSFYRTRLTALTWQEPDVPAPYQLGGFTRADFNPPRPGTSRHTATFFHESSGARLTVMLLPLDSDTVHLRLDLSLERDANRSAQHALRLRDSQRREQIIPVLVPPPGAQQRPRSGGGGANEFHSTATLTTILGLEALATHYAEQLRRAGWAQMANGLCGPLVWQSWQFTTEDEKPWTGLFFALQTPEKPDDYFLYVRAAWNTPAGNPHTIGWTSYGPGQR